MPKHAEIRRLPFSQQQMFDLVADVARYPEFLPWCVATRIRRQTPTEMVADMAIGFKSFRESFTSQVALNTPDSIDVMYKDGPFKYLINHWKLTKTPDGCEVDFQVNFEFRSRVLEKAIGLVFEQAVHRMVSAFEARALDLYGDSAAQKKTGYS
ncbi:MAG: type II toxin-antitoxin system RatA family toxin [Rhodospirillales bacterium]|jgi:coenzyme Q-binding protein COQ10|nr:type II toxin-antitoxin system RatA family toxin [Rhodospirillales bacterium]MBT4626324.1 type II toxin-antitoxin system RatA family toxin [Rhodospirillales bacterium]MBT5350228.1 type II toxin-antitoxin system RatA family toxin [Rhodospirillales bacterium]MBT5520835.1 type II toxin-antitoxin system RatA family toxin [Rhodospirillales bacterium]MBT6110706.1 type II toxin-antitoxin system RatA family toxin [Rhodospirillales bacterium]